MFHDGFSDTLLVVGAAPARRGDGDRESCTTLEAIFDPDATTKRIQQALNDGQAHAGAGRVTPGF